MTEEHGGSTVEI